MYEISSHETGHKSRKKGSSVLINLEFVYEWLTSKNVQYVFNCNSERKYLQNGNTEFYS